MKQTSHDEIAAAIQGIRNRLDTLASITASNMLIPSGPQERYHQIVEEAYAALGLIETQVDELRAELEYQHKRLDELRDAALAESKAFAPVGAYPAEIPTWIRRGDERIGKRAMTIDSSGRPFAGKITAILKYENGTEQIEVKQGTSKQGTTTVWANPATVKILSEKGMD